MNAHGILVLVHVAGAAIGIASGTVALLAPKGETLHRRAGSIFVVAMTLMSGVATILAAGFGFWESVLPGALTLYLVTTSFETAQGDGRATPSIAWYAVCAISITLVGFMLAAAAAMAQGGTLRGFPPEMYLVFAGIAGWSAMWDLTFWTFGRLTNRPRIARHLWRMTLALLLAITSLFIGRPQDFPEVLRGTILLKLPSMAVTALLLFWLVRIWMTRTFDRGSDK